MTESPAAGRLLISSAALLHPQFARTIVLLLNVDDEGALGVILNRPSGVPVGEVLQGWGTLVAAPRVLFSGGPVDTDSALGLAALIDRAEDPAGWRRLFEATGMVDLDTPTDMLEPDLAAMRIYAGYAGWAGGQLEAEISEGSWYVVPAEPADLFCPDPELLWKRVLRRQGGELAMMATMPVDPTEN